MYLKINRSVKTPWHRPGVGVARSRLWALVDGYSNINLKSLKVNALKELFWRLTISPIETIIKPTNCNQNLRQNIDTVCKSDLEVSSPFPNPGDHSKNVQCPPPPRLSIVLECEFTYRTLFKTGWRGTVKSVGTVFGSCGVVGRRNSRTSA